MRLRKSTAPPPNRTRRLGIAVFAAASATALASFNACNEIEPTEHCDGSFESVRQYVFEPACAGSGCHSGDDPAAVLDLTTEDAARALVTVAAGTCDGWTLVNPEDPESSFLWDKVHSPLPACGDPMPMGRGLRAAELLCLRRWIENVDASAGPGPGCETCGSAQCIDLSRDPLHCGACETACPAGSECTDGSCLCADGLVACGDSCMDTTADVNNCGECGQKCAPGALCNVGQCICGGGLESCGDSCVDTSSSASHCGSCELACASGQVCLRGQCSNGCDTLTQCGSACVDTSTSIQNCGSCDRACASGASCLAGSCTCPEGTSECAGQCQNTLSDPLNCGGCGQACASGLTCTDGTCQCPGGGTACPDGCVALDRDDANCGSCGNVCGAGQSCVSGTCTCGTAGTVSFSADIEPILLGACASRGCHDRTAKASLEILAGGSYAQLVGVAAEQCPERDRVVAGDPSRSYLMHKMLGQNMCQGSQMPKAGQSIPQADLDAIGAWICQGALNN